MLQVTQAQPDFTRVDKWLSDNLGGLGGRAVLLIYKDGKQLYARAENDMNRRQKMAGKFMARKTGKSSDEVLKDFDENSKINIASCSKWLSAALIMTFVDEGKLKTTDTIGRYLPIMTANGKGTITIADCLSHLTGIKSEGLKENKTFLQTASMQEAMKVIAALPVEAAPGKSFRYSSIGLQLAAAVIEQISGKDFETLFAERIAGPCDMKQTDFGHKKVPLAAGGAQSTATDYIHFLDMILHDGQYNGKTVLKKSSVAEMQFNYIAGKQIMHVPEEAGNWGYGYGEWVMDRTLQGKRSDVASSPGLFGSFPWVDNKNKYVGILLTFNLKHKGRGEKYLELKKLVDDAITKY